MNKKSKGEQVRQKLISLSSKYNIKYSNLETSFLIERLVARLISNETLATHLIFKGGFVGLRVYNSTRYTIDLDALLVKSNLNNTLELVKLNAEKDINDGVWFRFEDQIDLATQGEYGGIRQTYRVGIGDVLTNLKRAQVIHFDLGIGDPVTPGPQKIKTPSLLSSTENISWLVYPVETIIAEKIHALISHGDANSRSKDIYDLSIFLEKANPNILKDALNNCFEYRQTKLPKNIADKIAQINTDRLEKGWASAVSSLKDSVKFSESFNKLIKTLQNMKL